MHDFRLSLDVRLRWPDFDLEVRHDVDLHGITGLFGPSGGGKSTLLRVIAGLEKHAAGSVRFAGDSWQHGTKRQFVPAHKRPVGYVFQDARLFDHLDVQGNLDYASARAARRQGTETDEAVIDAFDLGPLLRRQVRALSGGERQRVAIARTLMSKPRLLLLDEPLAALDAGRKGEILPYLEALPKRFGIPALYVSHAIDEVARLAEQVIVLDGGRIRTSGRAVDILSRLGERSAHPRFEAATILEARVTDHLDAMHLTRLEHRGQSIVVPLMPHTNTGDSVRLHIRAGDVALATTKPEGLSFRNVLAGTLVAVNSDPDTAFASATIDIGGTMLRAHLTRLAVEELELEPGLPVFALLKTAAFDHRAPPDPMGSIQT